jgi:hypothetical protein
MKVFSIGYGGRSKAEFTAPRGRRRAGRRRADVLGSGLDGLFKRAKAHERGIARILSDAGER